MDIEKRRKSLFFKGFRRSEYTLFTDDMATSLRSPSFGRFPFFFHRDHALCHDSFCRFSLCDNFSFPCCLCRDQTALIHLCDSRIVRCPKDFLIALKKVCDLETIICITVPNDFSITQKKAYENDCIDGAFWVTKETSEHFNYFTTESLSQFAEKNGFDVVWKSADYPIDFNLFNSRTNYVRNKEVGHDGHIARLTIENMLYEKSLEDTAMLHSAFAKCGVGRDISVYLKLKK